MIPAETAIARVMRETGMDRLQAIRHLQGRAIIQAAPSGRPYRVSSDSAWPLRGADGRTFAERKETRR